MQRQPSKRGGRRRKDTPETRARILTEIRRGVGKCRAAILAGVSVDSLARWESEDAGFAEAIKGAELASVAALEKVVHGAARRGEWRAATWLLAHRCPDEYGPRNQRVEASVQVTMASLIAELDRLSPDAPTTATDAPSSDTAPAMTVRLAVTHSSEADAPSSPQVLVPDLSTDPGEQDTPEALTRTGDRLTKD